jgi:hypothetical protein
MEGNARTLFTPKQKAELQMADDSPVRYAAALAPPSSFADVQSIWKGYPQISTALGANSPSRRVTYPACRVTKRRG